MGELAEEDFYYEADEECWDTAPLPHMFRQWVFRQRIGM